MPDKGLLPERTPELLKGGVSQSAMKRTKPRKSRRLARSKNRFALEGKRKPRGRPFEKGNKIGHRFQPGESGNPGGSSKLQCLTAELHAQLPHVAKKLVANCIRRALKNSRDLELLWNRAEGSVPEDQEALAPGIKVVLINAQNRPPRPPAISIPTIPGLPAPRRANPAAEHSTRTDQESPRHLLGSP